LYPYSILDLGREYRASHAIYSMILLSKIRRVLDSM